MTNFGAKILNSAKSGLFAQQAIIATTGNNIANVNTPGYSRRVVDLETRGSASSGGLIDPGSGVSIARIRRIADEFLERAMRESAGDRGNYTVQQEFMRRIEPLFALDGTAPTIGSSLTGFFNSLNQLTQNPASLELRANVLARANDLITSLQSTYGSLASLQREADQRLATEIETVNALTSQIATLNRAITQVEASGSAVANDDRDRRAQLLEQLTEKLGVHVLEQQDGSVSVSLPNGFPLVVGGTARALEVTNTPSFATNGNPPALWGGSLNSVVFDFDPSSTSATHFDLTAALKEGGGTIGGLLTVRGVAPNGATTPFDADGPLVEVASRVEAITRTLLTSFNAVYLGDEDGNGIPEDRIGTPPPAPDPFNPKAYDLEGNPPSTFGFFTFPGAGDTDGNGYPTAADIDPTAVTSYTAILQLAISRPEQIAAAWDTSNNPVPTIGDGDGRNIERLAELQFASLSFSSGSYSASATTFDSVYNGAVTYVGNQKSAAEINAAVAEDRYAAAASRRDEVSAVSLDEEFTVLVQSQRAYQASARMISIAGQLLDEIVRLI